MNTEMSELTCNNIEDEMELEGDYSEMEGEFESDLDIVEQNEGPK